MILGQMQRLVLKPVSYSFKSQTQTPSRVSTHILSLYSKRLNVGTCQNNKFKLLSPRVVPEGKEYLVLQRSNGEAAYELMNYKGDSERRQVCQEDIPAGSPSTSHVENKLSWQFISRVYAILAAQISFCVVVSTIICLCVPVKLLLNRTHPFIAFTLALLPFIFFFRYLTWLSILVSWPLTVYRKLYPLNIILLGILTACVSIDIAICCAAMKVKIVLQALLVTMAGVTSLTVYTFWASKEGKSFSYLRPFLYSCLVILLVTGILQLFCPLVSNGNAIYAGLVAMAFSGYIVHDTDSMIKHYEHNEYIAASVSLFLDIVIFFFSNLDLLQYCSDLFT